MNTYDVYQTPPNGSPITIDNAGNMCVPNLPILPFIEGDGVGPEILAAAINVLDQAVTNVYKDTRKICWMELFAGQKAYNRFEEWLPQQTLDSIESFHVCLKGPLSTPKGTGFSSLNAALHQSLDLYASVHPIRYLKGIACPVKTPELIDMVVFRENSEDINAGLEWPAGSEESSRIIELLNDEIGCQIRHDSGIGIKSISVTASQRLMRKAIRYALNHNRNTVTIVHKGDVMKFTEGAFRDWGYQLAKEEFPDTVITEKELLDQHNGILPAEKLLLNDRVADTMFQQILTQPQQYSVLALSNLNGDYIADALAAQVGGMHRGACSHISDTCALFEPTHGAMTQNAGQNTANPCSLILSGAMMLDYLGWKEASDTVILAVEKTILQETTTYGPERFTEESTLLNCSEFGNAVVANMN